MRKPLLLLMVLCVITFSYATAQTNIVISKPQLEFKDNNIIVVYNILNAQDSQSFNISLDVADSLGNVIIPKALIGDFGDHVTGGENKKIYWNLTADNIYIDALLSVKIHAEVIVENDAISTKDSGAGYSGMNPVNPYAGISRGGVVVQSVLFPGWGLSRINSGPHWLKGLAGYGCLAGSIVFNTMALSNYRDYRNTIDVVERNRLYDLAVSQDKTSQGLAISAGAIWIADIIWTIAGSKKLKSNLQTSGISIESGYDPLVSAPLLTFKYSF